MLKLVCEHTDGHEEVYLLEEQRIEETYLVSTPDSEGDARGVAEVGTGRYKSILEALETGKDSIAVIDGWVRIRPHRGSTEFYQLNKVSEDGSKWYCRF